MRPLDIRVSNVSNIIRVLAKSIANKVSLILLSKDFNNILLKALRVDISCRRLL